MIAAFNEAAHAHDGDGCQNHPGARPGAATNALVDAALAATPAGQGKATHDIPPAPPGVTDLKFGELYRPIGMRGLDYTDKVRALAGRKVRMLGYMVRQCEPRPGVFLLTPMPLQLHEHEYGLAEDMPATLVHVCPTVDPNAIVPFTPGLLLLTGTLSLGPREEADGRISSVRLLLDPPAPAPKAPPAPAAKNSTATAPICQTAP
jgi:hypothetical protein